jgi:hypothetical protein
MLNPENLGLLILINAVFSFPMTTGIFEFFKIIGKEINSQKKGKMRWVVF